MPGALAGIKDAEVSDILAVLGGSWASIQKVSWNVWEKKHHSYPLPVISALLQSGQEVPRVAWPQEPK